MPSSRYLARDAVRLITEKLGQSQREPLSLLELGPGTGIFTEHIHPNLKSNDHFDVVELNSYFYNILNRKFRFNGEVTLHHADFLKFHPGRTYDFVISSLPYEQMPSRVALKMWRHKLALCKPGAHIIYYKYVNFNHFRSRFEKQLVRKYCSDEKIVFLNMPPARLFTLTIDDPRECIAVLEQDVNVKNGRFEYGSARNGKAVLEKTGNGKAGNEKTGSGRTGAGEVGNGFPRNGF
jgi:phosphatidylethanolamine/phosphatidyl-N-methylethanolamine N-methyltransferase